MLTYTLDAVIFGFSLVYLSVQLRPLHKGTTRVFLRVRVCKQSNPSGCKDVKREAGRLTCSTRASFNSFQSQHKQTNWDEDEVTNRNFMRRTCFFL